MPRAAQKHKLTWFGKEVWRAMVELGITTIAALLREMEENGDSFSPESVSCYLRGVTPVPPRFASALQKLPLSEEQFRRLAYAYFGGQTREDSERFGPALN